MDEPVIFKIVNGEEVATLHVVAVAANVIEFDLDFTGMDYHTVVTDLCLIAPHIMRLDGDLQEAYDDAFRTQPKAEDRRAVRAFLAKYKGRITPDDLAEMFFS